MADLFVLVSYHPHDEAWKDRVLTKLEGVAQLSCWRLCEDAEPSWQDRWKRELRTARAAVLLVSARSQGSRLRTRIEEPLLLERCLLGQVEVQVVFVDRPSEATVWDELPGAAEGSALSEVSEAEAEGILDRLRQALVQLFPPRRDECGPPEPDCDELFTRLYREHKPALVRFFGRRGLDPEVSRDQAQETMLKAYRSLSSLKNPAAAAGWIRKIALNVWRNYVRDNWDTEKRKGREVSEEELGDRTLDSLGSKPLLGPGPSTPEGDSIKQEERLYLAKGVQKLPLLQREVIELWLEGYSYEEIKTRLGISMKKVKSRLYRAKRRLKQLIQDSLEGPGTSLTGKGDEP